MRFVIALVMLAVSLQGQTDKVTRIFKDGSSRVQYVCTANSSQAAYTWDRGQFQITSVVDSGTTSTITFPEDHGLYKGAYIQITGADQASLNGPHQVASITSTKILTITTSGVTDGTYVEQTMKISTTWPRLNLRLWTLMVLQYAGGDTDPEGSHMIPGAIACTDRTNYL